MIIFIRMIKIKYYFRFMRDNFYGTNVQFVHQFCHSDTHHNN
jgi:hypothetical protein